MPKTLICVSGYPTDSIFFNFTQLNIFPTELFSSSLFVFVQGEFRWKKNVQSFFDNMKVLAKL